MNKSLRQRFGISMLAVAVLVASLDNAALRAVPDQPQQPVPLGWRLAQTKFFEPARPALRLIST